MTTGLAALLGPTGGYLIGFIIAAAFVGWLAQREWDRKWLRTLIAFVIGSLIIYAIALPWLYLVLDGLHVPNPLQATLAGGFYPFLIGDTIKALLAAGEIGAQLSLKVFLAVFDCLDAARETAHGVFQGSRRIIALQPADKTAERAFDAVQAPFQSGVGAF